jgi:hypothetical protein
VIALLVEFRELRIERFDLRLDLPDLEIILLQRQQSLNFLQHPASEQQSTV